MMHALGLFMVWLGGVLVGVVYSTLWVACRLKRIALAASPESKDGESGG